MNDKEEYNFGAYAKALRKDIADYVDARIEYTKLTAYEKLSKLIAEASILLLIIIFSFFTMFFLSFMAAVFIDRWLQQTGPGYAIVAVVDMVIIMIIIKKQNSLKSEIAGKVIDHLLKEHKDNNTQDETAG